MTSFIARRPVWALAVAVALALAALPVALRLETSLELITLLPADLPSVQRFREFERTVGGHTFLTVIVESPDRRANERFAEALAARLRGRNWAYEVQARREVDFIEQRWPFLVSERDLAKLEVDFREAMDRAKVRRSPLSIDLEEEPASTVWDQLRSFLNNGGQGQGSFREYRTNADGTLLLVQAQLRDLSSRVSVMGTILVDAQQDIDLVGPASYHPALQAHLYGALRHRVDEYNSILADLTRASLITFPLMLLVPALALRSRWEPAVVLVPVVVGMAWTYAGAQLAFGALNLVTCFLFLILFGLGDDYPIHLLFRIREEMAQHDGARAATERAIRRTVAPLAYAAATDTAALFSLAWMQFRGFSQFGLMAGAGIVLILVATFATVPGVVWLIRFRLRGELRDKQGSREETRSEPTTPPSPNWRWVLIMVGAWLVVIIASVWISARSLQFEDDFLKLHPNVRNLEQLRRKVSTIEGYQVSSPAVFFTTDFEESRGITRTIQSRLDSDGEQSPIGRIFSLASIVDGDTPAKRASLRRIVDLMDQPAFKRAPADVRRQAERLRNRLDLSPLTLEGIPATIRRSLTRDLNAVSGTRSTLYLVVTEPRRRVSLASEAVTFASRLRGVDIRGQEQIPAGEALIFAEILRLVREESWVAMAVACFATMAVVMLAFRSWASLLALALSETAAISATLGTLAVLGMRLSFFNIVVFPLLAGLGINYGIHILHRCHEDGVPATRAVRRLGMSVGSAAATTAVGFASLLVARHPGLWSLGFTAAVGICLTVASCLFFLPAFADLLEFLKSAARIAVNRHQGRWKM